MLQKAERLQATLHLTGQAQPQQKTLFEDEVHEVRWQAAATLDDGPSDSDNASALAENDREASATAALDADTAARVSRFDPRSLGLRMLYPGLL